MAGGLYGEQLIDYIIAGARRRGLDPAAVLAIASREGGFYGAVGDGGHSFGPWQLNYQGRLPKNVWAQGSGYAKTWANSEAGINYALDGIGGVARGLRGMSALQRIALLFENPGKFIDGIFHSTAAAEADAAHGVYGIYQARVRSGPSSIPGKAIPGTLPGAAKGGSSLPRTARVNPDGSCPPGYDKAFGTCVLGAKQGEVGVGTGGGVTNLPGNIVGFTGIGDLLSWIGNNWDRVLEVIGGFLLLLLGLYRLASQLGTAPPVPGLLK